MKNDNGCMNRVRNGHKFYLLGNASAVFQLTE